MANPSRETMPFFRGLCILLPLLLCSWPKPGAAQTPSKPLKIYHPLPQFSLVDAGGRAFSEESLKGKITVTNFFFTACRGPCPISMARLGTLLRQMPEVPELAAVSISVDPLTDTVERLSAYRRESLPQDDPRWSLLTGEPEQIETLLRSGFRVGAAKDLRMHSNSMVLSDKQGRIRGYYSGTLEDDLVRLAADIRKLAAE